MLKSVIIYNKYETKIIVFAFFIVLKNAKNKTICIFIVTKYSLFYFLKEIIFHSNSFNKQIILTLIFIIPKFEYT